MKSSTGSAGQAVEQATGEAKDAATLTEEELKKKAEEEAAAKAAAEAQKAVEKPAGGSG